jgi:hypothetical protein
MLACGRRLCGDFSGVKCLTSWASCIWYGEDFGRNACPYMALYCTYCVAVNSEQAVKVPPQVGQPRRPVRSLVPVSTIGLCARVDNVVVEYRPQSAF